MLTTVMIGLSPKQTQCNTNCATGTDPDIRSAHSSPFLSMSMGSTCFGLVSHGDIQRYLRGGPRSCVPTRQRRAYSGTVAAGMMGLLQTDPRCPGHCSTGNRTRSEALPYHSQSSRISTKDEHKFEQAPKSIGTAYSRSNGRLIYKGPYPGMRPYGSADSFTHVTVVTQTSIMSRICRFGPTNHASCWSCVCRL